jgi:TolB-like protein/Flp pilus assembly protein TadD
MIGQTISHYRIIDKLGEGGMGVVYKAEDTKLDRTVALKFLPSEMTRDPAARSRFIREAKAAAALHHPNICTIHEIDEHEDMLFIAMACVEGQTLHDRIEAGTLALQEALGIVIQIASGLHEAHKHGIVHRDVKPGNIMIDPGGRALLMDFGLAQRQEATRVTQTGTTLGTAAYMSPEQLKGEELDGRTDIWSLGVVLYELVAGCLPFKGEAVPSLVYTITREEPDPVTQHQPEVPAGLDGILTRALQKLREERYQDAASLQADLEILARDSTALPAGIPVRKGKRSRRWALFGAALVVAAVAAALFVMPGLLDRAQAINSLAVLSVANLSGDPGQDSYAAGMHVELISTLGKIDNLVVLGRRSVLKYAGSDLSYQEIAAELGVEAFMEGSMRIVEDRIHIAAELVKAATGQILWTDSFDGNVDEAMNFQRQIALAVARGIGAQLTPELEQTRTKLIDPEAYRLYLKFRADWSSSDAVALLQKVVEIDSTFAEAWAALSLRAAWGARYGHIPKDEGYELARTGARKAMALDPTLVAAYMSTANVHWLLDWDWEGAMEAIQQAATLNPMEPEVRRALAERLFVTGRVDEGIALYEEMIELAPLNPDFRQELGWHLGNIGEHELAIAHLERNLELFPGHYFTNMLLTLSYAAIGEYEKAVELREQMEQKFESMRVDEDGDGVREKGVGSVYRRGGGVGLIVKAYANSSARDELVEVMEKAKMAFDANPNGENAWLVAFYLIPLGELDEAREWLSRAAQFIRKNVQEATPHAAHEVFKQAYLYSALGDKDEAFTWLDLAFELRAAELVDLFRRTYKFAELWDDPRYENLMRRRGFPEEVIVGLRR